MSSGAVRVLIGALLVLAAAALVWSMLGERKPARLVGEDRVLALLGRTPRKIGEFGQVGVRRIRLSRPGREIERLLNERSPLEERSSSRIVVSDDRDAFFSASGTTFEIDLPEIAQGTLLVDLGVLVANPETLDRAGVVLPPASAMKFVVQLRGASGSPRTLLEQSIDLDRRDPAVWVPLEAPVSTDGLEAPRLSFNSRLVGFEGEIPLAVLQEVGGCWANPAIVQRPRAVRPPNVLVLSVDTLRADHLGAYGYSRETSPNIDLLLGRGALFENAISAAPWTLPSYGSLFTGLLPSEHRAGVKTARDEMWRHAESGERVPEELATAANRAEALAPDVVTLAEILRAQGYRTAGFVNNPFLHPTRGVDQGFDQYVWYQFVAAHGVDLAVDWIDHQQGAPFLLFLHLMDPHMPYAAPEPWDRRFSETGVEGIADYPLSAEEVRKLGPAELARLRQPLIDQYDAEIAYTDAEIGRLVDALGIRGLAEETIVVFHSDHGEELWEHGGFEHGHALYDEVLHVPLAIVQPGRIPEGVRVEGRVRSIDVMPTLLDLLGVAREPGRGLTGECESLAGTSLLPWIEGRRHDDLPAFAETLLYGPPIGRWNEAKAYYERGYKLIAGGLPEDDVLFDLPRDPLESTNAIATETAAAAELRARIEACREQALAVAAQSGTPAIPTHVEQEIRNTGYAGDDSDVEGEPEGPPPGPANDDAPAPGGD